MKREKVDYTIQTVEHALDVLEQFLGADDEFGVTDLSKRLRLHKNNIFRLLATLESHEFIEQNKATGNYRLGLRNLELGQIAARQTSILRNARPVLEALVRECNETPDVAVLRGGQIICLGVVESGNPVRVVPRIGIKRPVHCSAAGKVILAHAARGGVGDADPSSLRKKLEGIAEQGFATDDRELDPEVRSVAAPIFDYTRCVVGAVSVSGPVMRISRVRMRDELIPLVKRAAREISVRLGYG